MDKRFLDNFAFGRLRTSSEDFGLLREFSGNDRVVFKNPSTPRIKNLMLISQKKLAGIC